MKFFVFTLINALTVSSAADNDGAINNMLRGILPRLSLKKMKDGIKNGQVQAADDVKKGNERLRVAMWQAVADEDEATGGDSLGSCGVDDCPPTGGPYAFFDIDCRGGIICYNGEKKVYPCEEGEIATGGGAIFPTCVPESSGVTCPCDPSN